MNQVYIINLRRLIAGVAVLVMMAAVLVIGAMPAQGARCTDFLDEWANHGQHVIGNYLIGGAGNAPGEGPVFDWPPNSVEPEGPSLGAVIGGVGPFLPGASGSIGHRIAGPGASFCDPVNL